MNVLLSLVADEKSVDRTGFCFENSLIKVFSITLIFIDYRIDFLLSPHAKFDILWIMEKIEV